MDVANLLVAGRLLLSAVFGVAALAKLADREGSRRSLQDFGVPDSLVPAATVLLPVAELVVAVALLPAGTAWWGAVGASALLLVFLAAIGHQFSRGRRPDCHCFGQLHSEPIGWPVIARNAGLLAVAGGVVVAGWGDAGPGAFAWLGPLTLFERVVTVGGGLILVALAGQARTLRAILDQQRALGQRLDGLQTAPAGSTLGGGRNAGRSIGSAAPGFSLPSLDDGVLTLDGLRLKGKPVVLVFSDPNCGPCEALLPQIAAWQKGHADVMTMALVTRGTPDANRQKSDEHGVRRVLIEEDREVSDLFGVWGTPSAVMIRADGTVGSLLAQAESQIRELVDSVVGMSAGAGVAPPAVAATPAGPVQPPVAPVAGDGPPAGLTLGGGLRPPPRADVSLDMRFIREDCVQDEALPDGGTVLYNGCRKQVLTLNGTAALVWEYCDGESDVRTVIEDVRGVFPAAAEVEQDVRRVFEQLLDAGMVAPRP